MGQFFSPFYISIEKIERLMLINIDKDPDEIYIGFEPQVFDSEKGKGIRVIAWRKDAYVDVYQQPGIPLSCNNLDAAAKGLKDIVHAPMEDARFEITPFGADVYFRFTDSAGRLIEVEIKENSKKKTKPFSLLAPVGSSSKTPSALPLFFLYNFYFVRRKDTTASVMIGDRRHKPDTFPLPIDGSKIYFMRYSADPFLVNLNTAHSGPVQKLAQKDGVYTDSRGFAYQMEESGGRAAFKQIFGGDANHKISILFRPAFPEISSFPENFSVKGTFSIIPYPNAGIVEGIYSIERKKTKLVIGMEPLNGWKPYKPRLMPAIIFTVAPVFKKWPGSYRWRCTVDLGDEKNPVMQSGWERV